VEITNTVSLYIPNSFTPDGEEENATFYPVFSPGFTPENYWFAIYNRWGEIVFESYDVANGWDGYLPYGIKCPLGVYTYVLRYGGQEDGQWEQFYGFVNLIR
jgi:gliding motility-associated-like protein